MGVTDKLETQAPVGLTDILGQPVTKENKETRATVPVMVVVVTPDFLDRQG